MLTEQILTYLQDILNAINDVQSCFIGYPNRYDVLEQDMMRQCVVERKVEVMGEAINRIKKLDASVQIPNARAIVDTRNGIIHSYDMYKPTFYGDW